MTYMIAGGGTGGHIFPAIAIAEAIRARRGDARILFVGTRYGMEKTLIPKAGYRLLTLPIRGLVGKGLGGKLALLWRLPTSLLLSLWMLVRYRPGVVIGVGGYASAPLMLVAGLLRFPTMIQEQNAFPGLTNRIGARFARLACLGFPEAGRHLRCPSLVTGNPVRATMSAGPAWSPDRHTILIVGGSQGALALNREVPGLLKRVLTEGSGIRVVHQCGRDKEQAVRAAYEGAAFAVEVTGFIEDMSAAWDEALLVICRAGASTIGELRQKRVPAVLVPFPAAAGDHQTHNARSLADRGAAVLIAEADLPESAPVLASLLADRDTLAAMVDAMGRPETDSAGRCAEIALALERGTEVSRLVEEHAHVS